MIHKVKSVCASVIISIVFLSCTSKPKDEVNTAVHTGTPVSVTSVVKTTLVETVELNATSIFLLKTPVRSVTSGYLQQVAITQGAFVTKGQVLMTLITKEAHTIGTTITSMDTSLHFKGEITIIAPCSGYISQLNFQSKDYVQDGEQVAMISDAKSFAFMLDLPYELSTYIKANKYVQLTLPDSTKLSGTIEKPFPTVDPLSQTQSYLIAIHTDKLIPENLIAKVVLVKSIKQNAIAVAKSAILTNETQSTFWIMKLINDSTAVKITIQKGIQSNGLVEIVSPIFTNSDKIVTIGNYGLADTAFVYLSKEK